MFLTSHLILSISYEIRIYYLEKSYDLVAFNALMQYYLII